MNALKAELTRRASRTRQKPSLRTQEIWLVVGLVIMDFLTLALAFYLAFVIRFELVIPIFRIEVEPDPNFYMILSLALIPLWLILFALYKLYDYDTLLGGMREYMTVFNACITGLAVVTIVQYFVESLVVARGWLGLSWLLTFLLITMERFLMRRVGYALRRRGYLTAHALILGVNPEAEMLGMQLLEWPSSGLNPLGYLDDQAPLGHTVIADLKVIGRLDQLDALVQAYDIEEIILVSSVLPRSLVMGVFQRYGTSEKVHLRMSSGLFDLLNTGLNVKEMGYVPLIGVNRVRLTPIETLLKRGSDIIMAVGGLLLGLPFLPFLALAIKLDSRGSIFYRRRVMGLNGTQFDAFKFRTMRADGDSILKANPHLQEELDENYKIKDDPRVTKFGALMRKYSIDELPQIYNILRGEMSVVGPRMISPPELKKYGQWGMNLLTVRPGLTGLWQVSGRSDVSYEDRVRLDMFYIRNYSIWLDIQIILKTIPAVINKRGAY